MDMKDQLKQEQLINEKAKKAQRIQYKWITKIGDMITISIQIDR